LHKKKLLSFLLSLLMIVGCFFSSGNVLTLEAASAYDKICTPNTSSYIYIWKSKSTDSAKLGEFKKGDGASIEDSSDSVWLKITSGSITGYVKKENVLSGSKLETFAQQNNFPKQIKVTASSLRVRKDPSTSSAILTGVSKGQTYAVLNETADWAQIKVGSITGYVAKEYTTWSYLLGTADKYGESDSDTSSDSSSSSGLYNNIAVAKVSSGSKLNVRSSASTSASIVGKMVAGSAATIVSKGDSWTKIKSGNVTGYISNSYYVSGDAAESYAKSLGLPKQATLKTNMNVRQEPSVSSARVGGAKEGATFLITGDNGTWVSITFNGKTAYLKKSYLTISYKFKEVTAVGTSSSTTNSNNSTNSGSSSNTGTSTNSSSTTGTVTASTLTLRNGAGTSYSAITDLPRGTKVTITGSSGNWYKVSVTIDGSTKSGYVSKTYVSVPNSGTTSSGSTSNGSSGSATESGSGDEIAAYALQFLGNPYVYGGTSLTNGCDCSGFVQSVFKHFGYSLPRTSAAQSKGGTTVSFDNLKKGDLLFYGNNGTVNHVGIYIGDGKIINASNERVGIVTYRYNYRTPIRAARYWN